MAVRGTLFEDGPTACPFVALELDRDRRSQTPDYRHRCYAEPTPAPRTIAHQDQFCLSPGFASCPIFLDWAVRAAARPVPLPQGYEGRRSLGTDVADAVSATTAAMSASSSSGNAPSATLEPDTETAADPDAATPTPPADLEGQRVAELSTVESPLEEAELAPAHDDSWLGAAVPDAPDTPDVDFDHTKWPDSMATAGSFITGRATDQAGGGTRVEQEQLPFDAQPEAPLEPVAITPERDHDWDVASGESAAGPTNGQRIAEPPRPTFDTTYDEAYARRVAQEAEAEPEEAPVPGFLAGREAAAARAPRRVPVKAPDEHAVEVIKREDVVPSWGIDDRHGARTESAGRRERVNGGRVLTAVAVVLTGALALLAVLIVPGLLAGSGPGATPPRSPLASLRPTAGASSAIVLPSPTAPPPSVTPPTVAPGTPQATPPERTPRPTPRTYRIKAGDTLGEVAARFGVTVAQILEANPEINKPANIRVGQTIVIPRQRNN